MRLLEYVEKNSRLYPSKAAFIFEDIRCSFLEFSERVYRLTNGLISLGVKKGDKVAVVAENCFEWPEIYMGAGKAGAVVVPLNYRLIPRELSYLIGHSEATTIIVSQNFAQAVDSIRSELKMVKNYICIGDSVDMISYNELLSNAATTKPELKGDESDLYLISYTGGTTGRPKGAMLTYKNLWEQILAAWIIELERNHDDIGVVNTPLFHSASYWPLFGATVMGNTQMILGQPDAASLLEAIHKEKITILGLMPLVINFLLSSPDLSKYDLSSLRVISIGGAPANEAQLRSIMDITGCRVLYSGGQTEVGIIAATYMGESGEGGSKGRLGTAGREVLNIQLRVVDDNDNDVAPDQVGELVARGPGVMQGYWRLPEETAESLKSGWQHTGDLVRIDEEGYIWYVDRKKDMIRSGGENVYSKEVEDVIYTHPSVSEVAVIGVPDEKWIEAVKALVILKEGHEAAEKEIIDHCRKYISGFKCPKSVEFCSSFPRTGLGKINKVELRQMWKK
ncbi:long-chain-fatty-acid--CoA ligase [Chloroflexota bacterium]